MRLRDEWENLRVELSQTQQRDGRRCFYCGALAVISAVIEGELDIAAAKKEIEEALTYPDDTA